MLIDLELQRRKPVWTAISELWLDTELDRADLQRISQIAAASGYSEETLNDIYLYEVAPVVGANLHVPAGVWSGFDEAWLHAEVRKRAESRGFWLRLWVWSGFGRKWMTYATESHWREVLALVGADREID